MTTPGVDGEQVTTYRVTVVDGVETGREALDDRPSPRSRSPSRSPSAPSRARSTRPVRRRPELGRAGEVRVRRQPARRQRRGTATTACTSSPCSTWARRRRHGQPDRRLARASRRYRAQMLYNRRPAPASGAAAATSSTDRTLPEHSTPSSPTGCWARPPSASWPSSWTCGRPRRSGRTSCTTRTPSGGSCAPPTSGPTTSSSRSGPGLGLAHPRPAAGRRARGRRRDRPAAGRAAAASPWPSAQPDLRRPADRRRGRRAARPGAARPAADGAGGQPAVQRRRAGAAAPAGAAARRCDRALVLVQAEVAERLAAPPGSAGLRRPVGEGRLVRRRPPGRQRRPARLLARAQRRLGPGGARPPSAAARATGGATFAVVDAAFATRRKGAARGAGPLGRAAPPRPRRGCAPPGSTPSTRGRAALGHRLRPAGRDRRRWQP